jgi:hypothetical protein
VSLRANLGRVVVALVLAVGLGASLPAAASKSDPTWRELSPAQREVLAPLKDGWSAMEPTRKRKWVGVANRYPTMNADEQARVRERMAEWAALAPEQRRAARDNFRAVRDLDPDARNAVRDKWQAYQNLPEDKRRELNTRATRPAPSAAPAEGANPAATPTALRN